MKEKLVGQAFPIPMGQWDLETGVWTPNEHLKASRAEQYNHNVKYGYLEKGSYLERGNDYGEQAES